MTGKEIYDRILTKHNRYVKSNSDNDPRLEEYITPQQCFKLADHLGYAHKFYNSLTSLACGDLNYISFGGVIVRIKK